MKANTVETGREIVNLLAQKLAENDFNIQIRTNYTLNQKSLVAVARGIPFCELSDRRDKNSPSSMEELAYLDIIKGTKSASEFIAPVRPESETDDEYAQLYGIYFAQKGSLSKALDFSINGSFSFDSEGQLFYSPVHIDIMHENLHIINNAEGTNREAINPGHPLWTNGEEYWVIKGGNLNENKLNNQFGLPERYGHLGMPAHLIISSLNHDVCLKDHVPKIKTTNTNVTPQGQQIFSSSTSSSSYHKSY